MLRACGHASFLFHSVFPQLNGGRCLERRDLSKHVNPSSEPGTCLISPSPRRVTPSRKGGNGRAWASEAVSFLPCELASLELGHVASGELPWVDLPLLVTLIVVKAMSGNWFAVGAYVLTGGLGALLATALASAGVGGFRRGVGAEDRKRHAGMRRGCVGRRLCSYP